MSSMYVFRPRVMLWVISEVDGAFIVQVKGRRCGVVGTELVEEGTQVRCFFRGFRRGYNFSFAGRQCHGGLFLAAPGDGSATVHEHMSRRGVTGGPVRV
eukprot:4800977-Pleurochrysis_carterae.AAC.1